MEHGEDFLEKRRSEARKNNERNLGREHCVSSKSSFSQFQLNFKRIYDLEKKVKQ
jgi:hypothetical protein